jgi:hypothetical protein
MDFDIDLTLERVKYILAQSKKEALNDDLIVIYIIELIFKKNEQILFPDTEEIEQDLLIKFVEMIFALLNIKKEKRKSIYKYLNDVKQELFKEMTANDIKEFFEEEEEHNEKSEIKMSNLLLEKKIPKELNELLKAINKINMDKKNKEKLLTFENALGDFINSLTEDNTKIKEEQQKMKQNEQNLKKEMEEMKQNEQDIKKEMEEMKQKFIKEMIRKERLMRIEQEKNKERENNLKKEMEEMKKLIFKEIEEKEKDMKQKVTEVKKTEKSFIEGMGEIKENMKLNQKELEYNKAKLNFMINLLNEKTQKCEELKRQAKLDIYNLKEEVKKITDKNISLEEKIDALKIKEKQNEELLLILKNVYENIICPIGLTIMDDPVITPWGATYSRAKLIEWLEKKTNEKLPKTDPFSNRIIDEKLLYKNLAVKNISGIIRQISAKYKLES